MKTINLPGFTAEASLYKARELGFRNSPLVRQHGSNNAALVHPAASRRISGPCEDAGGILICTSHGCFCV